MIATLLTLNALGYVAAFVCGWFFMPKVVAFVKAQIAKI